MVGIGFFAPFPLALMVPFMAGQSLAMGEAFGKGFQYGKRKISSMDNKEFNALNFQQLSESLATDYKVMIPSLTKSIQASDELQRAVFKALGDLLLDIPDAIKDFFTNATVQQESSTNKTSTIINAMFGLSGSGGAETLANDPAFREQLAQIEAFIKAAGEAIGGAIGPIPDIFNSKTNAKKKETQRQQDALVAAAQARTASEAKTGAAAKALAAEVSRTGAVTSRRKAGQSQKQQRNLHIIGIKSKQNIISFYQNQMATGKTRGTQGLLFAKQQIAKNQTDMRTIQAKLTILLKRYDFS